MAIQKSPKPDADTAIQKHLESIAQPTQPMLMTFLVGVGATSFVWGAFFYSNVFTIPIVGIGLTTFATFLLGWAWQLGGERKAHVASLAAEVLANARRTWATEIAATLAARDRATEMAWNPEFLLSSLEFVFQSVMPRVTAEGETITLYVRVTSPSPIPFTLCMKSAQFLITDANNVDHTFAPVSPKNEIFDGASHFTKHFYFGAVFSASSESKGVLTSLLEGRGFVRVVFRGNFEVQTPGFFAYSATRGDTGWFLIEK